MNKGRAGTWSVVAVLIAFLGAAIVFAYKGLTVHSDLRLPVSADVALALGVLFSLLFGIGLMALVFYSSRAGYDDPPQIEGEPPDDEQHTSEPPKSAA
jgi:hypothetical protein